MSDTYRNQLLEPVIATIRQRWGQDAIQRLSALSASRKVRSYLPTGFDALDHLLEGGLPTGTLSIFSGRPTSGKTVTALCVIAHAQRDNQLVAWIDPQGVFDGEVGARLGINLDNLMVIQSSDERDAWIVCSDLVHYRIFSCLVLDSQASIMPAPGHFRALIAALRGSPVAGLLLSPHVQSIPSARISLNFRRVKWLFKNGDVSGYTSQVSLLKGPSGQSGKSVHITLSLPESSE